MAVVKRWRSSDAFEKIADSSRGAHLGFELALFCELYGVALFSAREPRGRARIVLIVMFGVSTVRGYRRRSEVPKRNFEKDLGRA